MHAVLRLEPRVLIADRFRVTDRASRARAYSSILAYLVRERTLKADDRSVFQVKAVEAAT